MRIILNGRDVSYINNDRVVGFETDNDVNEFICVVEDSIPTPAWGYKLDVKAKLGDKTFYNTINLTKSRDADNEYGVLLGANMLPQGKCLCNIRRISGKKVYNSDVFEMWVKKPVLSYCGAYQEDGFIPSEFFQIEQRMDEINNHPPVPDASGYWKIWNADKGEYEISDIPSSGGTVSFIAGDGLDIQDNKISIKTDKKSISVNEDNEIYVNGIDGDIL